MALLLYQESWNLPSQLMTGWRLEVSQLTALLIIWTYIRSQLPITSERLILVLCRITTLR